MQPGTKPKWLWMALIAGLLALLILLLCLPPLTGKRTEAQTGRSARKMQIGRNRIPFASAPATQRSGGAPDRPLEYRLARQTILTYGAGPGELGMVRHPEQEPVGPEAFAIDAHGNVLVADRVNHRVQVFAPDGTFLRSIDLGEAELSDVVVDRENRLFVFDAAARTLRQYDPAGRVVSSLSLRPGDIDTRGYFHISGDSVYFADACVRDVLVGKLKDGLLAAPADSETRTSDGIHGETGRLYQLEVKRNVELVLRLGGMAQPVEAQLPFTDIVSARFIGEDQQGRFHVQIERVAGGKVLLDVLSFRSLQEPWTTTHLPENDYLIWTTKLVDVAPDGTLVQFLPRREEAQLNFFKP